MTRAGIFAVKGHVGEEPGAERCQGSDDGSDGASHRGGITGHHSPEITRWASVTSPHSTGFIHLT